MTPKAIQTHYAGCHFRSRLEARWAVFFDHLDVEWQYEPEGFDLPSGRYLPDFFLPCIGVWLEIKVNHPDRGEQLKAIELAIAVHDAHQRVRVLVGDIPRRCTPAERVDWARPLLVLAGSAPAYPVHNDATLRAYNPRPTLFSVPGDEAARERGALAPFSDDPDLWALGETIWFPGFSAPEVDAALSAARSARFEHGQSGGTR